MPHIKKLPRATAYTEGFTLIELSIVLVIIGLLVGGVLVGKDLIKAAEIRSQIKQIEEFKTAANAFKLKYGYLPGDIPPAQASQLGFFTFTGPYAGKSYLIFSGGAGQGDIRYGFGNGSSDIEWGESYVFWQHLSEAKMIAGSYGGSSSGTNYLQPDTSSYFAGGMPINTPAKESAWDIFRPKTIFSHTYYHINVYPNRSYTKWPFYSDSSLANIFSFSATPNQQYAIDSKIDDGFPGKGTIRDFGIAFQPDGYSYCGTGSSPSTYDLTPSKADIDNNCGLAILW
jgi:prepilin-type N-terminal cleavage/methylation domain-containing protein